MDGQTERVNQIVEDMLRAYALKDSKSWDKCLLYAEFSYNNSYQKSLKMSPFEVLYGCKCRTPLFWNEPGENQVFGPEILREAGKQVHIVRENLQLAQSRQKSYADHRGRAWGVGGLQGGAARAMGGGHGLRLPALFVSCSLCVCEGRRGRRKERKKKRKEKKKKKEKNEIFSKLEIFQKIKDNL
jgi:hypothetical protein